MNVLVTGGSGKLGGVVVADLVAHGHNVLNADLVAPAQRLCPFLQVDLQDAGQVLEAIGGVDFCQSSDAIVRSGSVRSLDLYTGRAHLPNIASSDPLGAGG